MKNLFILLFLLSAAQISLAGEMPAAIKCTDSENRYDIKIVTLGTLVDLNGQRLENGIKSNLNYRCAAQYLPVGSSTLLYTCLSNSDENEIKFYKNQNAVTSGQMTEISSLDGTITNLNLSCERTHL